MLTDEIILNELELRKEVSISYIQMKYKLRYEEARRLQHRWATNEPKEPTFEEKLQKWQRNLPIRPKIIKKRFTAFRLGDRFFDTYEEFEKELNRKVL